MPVARIEPIPWDQLPAEAKAMIESGEATGMYTTPVPLQVMAYSTAALRAMHDSYRATFRAGVLDERLAELLRLRSATAGGCALCMSSRKDDSVSEDDVACLMEPDPTQYTARELAAMRYFDRIAYDHLAIGDDTYRELHELFTTAEIVELAYFCASAMGTHRFMHTLAFESDAAPVIAFDASEIDRARAAVDV
jgi:alkylhydroperoxidase family enzyme